MKKKEVIKSKKDYSELINKSRFVKNKYFIIYYRNNNLNKNRFGLAISTKIGNAVQRNKLKRQTREMINTLKSIFKKNRDYIIMIRKGNLEDDFQTRLSALEKLIKEKI